MKVLSFAALLAATACATTGSTFRSGVGDRQLEHPPYYAGQQVVALQSAAQIAHFPVEFQRGASQPDIFDPASGTGSAVAALLADMNAVLDSVMSGARLAPAARGAVPPNVYFGCELDAMNDCVQRGDSVLGRRGTTMRLAVERPSPSWTADAGAQLAQSGATLALVLTLEVGQYWPRQSGIRGDKSVELGVGHTVPLPWITSLETPVSVLQLTGALVDGSGKALKIGAEGILPRRTSIVASGFGLQRLISEDDVKQARTLRHADRPGQPLVWREALCGLVLQLSGQRCG